VRNRVYIYFSKPKSIFWFPLSFLIRWVESPDKCKLWPSSHAAIELDENVYEAILFIGVRKIPFHSWLKKNHMEKKYYLDISEDDFEDIFYFCEGSIGIPYATLELFGLLYSKIMLHLFNRQIKNPLNIISRKVKCTEFVLESLSKVHKIDLKSDINNIGVRDAELIIAPICKEIL